MLLFGETNFGLDSLSQIWLSDLSNCPKRLVSFKFPQKLFSAEFIISFEAFFVIDCFVVILCWGLRGLCGQNRCFELHLILMFLIRGITPWIFPENSLNFEPVVANFVFSTFNFSSGKQNFVLFWGVCSFRWIHSFRRICSLLLWFCIRRRNFAVLLWNDIGWLVFAVFMSVLSILALICKRMKRGDDINRVISSSVFSPPCACHF